MNGRWLTDDGRSLNVCVSFFLLSQNLPQRRHMKVLPIIYCLFVLSNVVEAFRVAGTPKSAHHSSKNVAHRLLIGLHATDKDDEVELGSRSYYEGFLTRKVNDGDVERLSGDSLLGPTLRLAGQASAILVLLTLAFLLSNGIIFS